MAIQPDRKLWHEPELGGEWFLWKAVLHLSLFDLSNKTRRDAALSWILSDDQHVGSVDWICVQLDLDLAAVRTRALKIYDGLAHLTSGVTRRNWKRRVNRNESYRSGQITVHEN